MDSTPEQAWLDGRAAARAKQPRAANPHSAHTDLAQDWLGGWLEGERERLARPVDPGRGPGPDGRAT